jgi:protein-S-isoprenylcysteine O-methyltransferase Ste14
MTWLLLVVLAWRLVRPLVAIAIVVAFATLLLGSGSLARHAGRNTRAIERVVRPIEHALRRELGQAFQR